MESALEVKRNETQGTAALLQRLAKERTHDAWAMLLERHGVDILGVARRVLRDPSLAEDASQETLLQLREYAGRFEAPDVNADQSARAWIIQVAYRVALNMLRSRRRGAEREVRKAVAGVQTRGDSGPDGYDERMEPVLNALEHLPEKYREPLALHFLGELDYEQLGGTLRCSAATAKMRVHRGLERLRERLGFAGLVLSVGMLDGILKELGTRSPQAWAFPDASSLAEWKQLLDAPGKPPPVMGAPTKGWSLLMKLAMASGTAACTLALLAAFQSTAQENAPVAAPAAPQTQSIKTDVVAQALDDLHNGDAQRSAAAQSVLLAACPAALPKLKAAYAATEDRDARARIDTVRRAWYEAHPDKAFKLSVAKDGGTHPIGGNFDAQVSIENISDMRLGVLKSNRLNNLMDVWTFKLKDAHGHEAPDSSVLKTFTNQPIPYTSEDYELLEPGTKIEIPVQVRVYHDIRPGKFSVHVQYHFAGKAATDASADSLNHECLKGTWKDTFTIHIIEKP